MTTSMRLGVSENRVLGGFYFKKQESSIVMSGCQSYVLKLREDDKVMDQLSKCMFFL